MKLNFLLVLPILLFLAQCNGPSAIQNKVVAPMALGDTVQELSNNIMVVYQDQKSNYWFGTWDNGVFKYDGVTLTHFTTQHGLPNNRIDEIKEDKEGKLYFVCCYPRSTVAQYDGKTFVALKATPSDSWRILPDDLWLRHSFQSEKVYRFDGVILHELSLSKPPTHTNPFEIYSVFKDMKGNIWFGTNPLGACRYNGTSFDWIMEKDVAEVFNDASEGANGVRSIVEDKNGAIWFNTEYRYTVSDSIIPEQDLFYTKQIGIGSLDGRTDGNLNEYLSALQDKQDQLWFVTYRNGVWKYDGVKITHYTIQEQSKDIPLFSIYEDRSGKLWIGTHANGVYTFNGISFERFKN